MVMQVLVLAVQNSVEYEQLGVATSGATLFRSIGGSVGTAILGAVFTNRLTDALAGCLPPNASANVGGLDPSALERLPAADPRRLPVGVHRRDRPRVPRRGRDHDRRVHAQLVHPRAPAAHDRAHRRPAADVRRAGGHRLRARGRPRAQRARRQGGRARRSSSAPPARAELDIPPAGGWLLARAASEGTVDVQRLAATYHLDEERLRAACHDLHSAAALDRRPGRHHRA